MRKSKAAGRKTALAVVRAVTARTRAATSAEADHHSIEVAAYHLAQQRGFLPGHELDDWLQAEAALRAQR